MDWITLIEGLVTGGALVSICTLPSIVKKAKAEARAAEIENMKSVADGWKTLADERQEANREKDERIAELTKQIDERYIEIGNWRDKYNAQQEDITSLKVQIAANTPKICEVKGCSSREPQSGY